MKVTLRERLSKKTNRITLYLDIYKGYTKDLEGKLKQKRDYVYLKYYLIANPKTAADKQHNKDNQRGAEAVKAKYLLEFQNGAYGFIIDSDQDVSLIEYFKKLTKAKFNSQGNYGNWASALKHLMVYCDINTKFKDVDVKFVEGFKDYLQYKAKMKTGKLLSTNSALSYFNKFRIVVNEAFDEGFIKTNPIKRVKAIQQEETHREYLTFDELKSILKVECRYEVLKRAFLFSCLTGLRWSDIYKLTWKELKEDNGSLKMHFTQKKTKSVEYLNISDQASRYIGERGNADQKVFAGLQYGSYQNVALTQWMLKAGITRHITFHCARHTFATLQLTLGTELYTISKLLGHKNLKTTQIYVNIIDAKKQEAVNKIPDLLAND